MSGCHPTELHEGEIDEFADKLVSPMVKQIQKLEERIKKLELENEMRRDTIGCIDSAYNDAFLEVDKRLQKLEEITKRITEDDMKAGKKPHKCPLCEGKGKINFLMPQGTYWAEKCNPCGGDGIIWG